MAIGYPSAKKNPCNTLTGKAGNFSVYMRVKYNVKLIYAVRPDCCRP